MLVRMHGPEIAPVRIVVPGTETYVEIRQEIHDKSEWIGYAIETGHVRWGHSGTWGRDNLHEAFDCFGSAIAYAAKNHRGRD